VIASGTTSSTIARQENAARKIRMSQRDRLRRSREFSEDDYHEESEHERADQAEEARQPLRGAERQERAAIGAAIQKSSRMANINPAESQEHARHHAHHDRHRTASIAAAPNRTAQREHKDPGRDVRADHLGVAQMTSAGPTRTAPGIVQKKTSGWR